MSAGSSVKCAEYYPLTQCFTDTDSSEEELSSSHNSRKHAIYRSTVPSEFVDKINAQKMGEYHTVGNEIEPDVFINGMNSQELLTTDDVKSGLSEMSPLRKLMFILSLALCGVAVIVFLFVLPCDWETCPILTYHVKSQSWERVISGIELTGAINIVKTVDSRGHNLLFMFQRDILNLDLINNEAGGIIALKGYTGHDAWMTKLHNVPQDMDCSLIDIDKDNVNDCIVVGENGLLAAIEPLYGNVLWYMHDHNTNMQPSKLDFPIMFPDVNGDDINELLVPCSLSDRRNSLVLVSGRRGNILGKPLNFTGCLAINSVSLEKDWSITYICHLAGDKEAVQRLSFQEVCNGVSDLNEVEIQTSQLKQHRKQTAEANKGWSLTVEGNRLVGDNSVQCTLLINLTDQHTGVARWNYSHEQMYGMMPTMFTFKTPSGESAVGLIFKLWEWVPGTSGCSLNTNFMFCNQPGQTNHEGLVYEDLVSSADPRNMIPGSKQTLRSSHDNCPAMNTLIEHILVLTFNSTHVVELNTSQSNVTQFCSSPNTTDGEKLCQPSIQHQQQSVLIADLDEDGYQELVFYLTTYIPRSQVWQLQTTVRMVPLTNITNS